MSICGQYVKSFAEGNLASVTDISLDGDYKHFFFDVVGEVGKHVELKSHYDSTLFSLKKSKDKAGREFCWIELSSFFERMTGKPGRFKIYPMKGERL